MKLDKSVITYLTMLSLYHVLPNSETSCTTHNITAKAGIFVPGDKDSIEKYPFKS